MKNVTFEEFPLADFENWKKLALKELREQPFENLVWKNENGFEMQPYYSAATSYAQTQPSQRQSWNICQSIVAKSHKEANRAALQCLKGGANAICFDLAITTQEELSTTLENIGINYIAVHYKVSNCNDALQVMKLLQQYCAIHQLDSNVLNGSLRLDVMDTLSQKSQWTELFAIADAHFSKMRLFVVSADRVHNAGGTAAQDIAYALSVGNEFLHQCKELGLSIAQAQSRLQFNFATDSSYFTEIAKYRVFRNLWATVAKQYDASANANAFIHAETSGFLQTTRDAYNNLLRATTQAMSAVIGMVDSLEVIAYDEAFASASEISLRFARNIQHLLMEESSLNGVQDFAAGSHYQETLAAQLSQAAWEMFLDMEKSGGITLSLIDFEKQIQLAAQEKRTAVTDGKKVLVGVNKYINKNEEDIKGSPGRLTSDI
jgi:methylmalonyl-CoA mutase